MVDVEIHDGRSSKSLGKEPNEQGQVGPYAVASEEQLGSPYGRHPRQGWTLEEGGVKGQEGQAGWELFREHTRTYRALRWRQLCAHE